MGTTGDGTDIGESERTQEGRSRRRDLPLARLARVERVAHAVAHHVERECREQDHRARDEDKPGRQPHEAVAAAAHLENINPDLVQSV